MHTLKPFLQLSTSVGLLGLFWFGFLFLFEEYLLEASLVASRGFISFSFCQQVPCYLWVLPSSSGSAAFWASFFGEGSLLGASLISSKPLLGETPLPDASFFDKAPLLDLALSNASAFAAAASSRLLASSTSFSAIRLHEQNLNLRYCKRRETDLYWLSNSSSSHSMSSINCHSIEKQKVSNYPLKSKYVLTAFT